MRKLLDIMFRKKTVHFDSYIIGTGSLYTFYIVWKRGGENQDCGHYSDFIGNMVFRRIFNTAYPQFTRKTVRRHKICVLLRCFRSMYARYMSFKRLAWHKFYAF